jgi:hypothetical protein
MAFTPDPNAPRVIDIEKGYALHPIVRDVPDGEEWFRFVFEGTQITAKSKRSWMEERKVTFVFDAKQLAKAFYIAFCIAPLSTSQPRRSLAGYFCLHYAMRW